MANQAGVQPLPEAGTETPAPQPTPAAPTGETPSDPGTPTAPTADQTLDWLNNQASLDDLEATVLGEATPPQPQTPPVDTSQAGATPTAPLAEPPAATPSAPNRVRLTGLSDTDKARVTAAVRAVEAGDYTDVSTAMTALGMPPAQADAVQTGGAVDALVGTEDPASEAPVGGDTPPAVQPDATPAPQSAADIQTALDAVQDQLQDARDDLSPAATIRELENQQMTLNRSLMKAELAEEHETVQQGNYEQNLSNSVDQLMVENPDLRDTSSRLHQRVVEMRKIAQFDGDPVLETPAFMATFVEKAKAELGMNGTPTPTQAAADPLNTAPPAQQQPVPIQRQQPVGQLAVGGPGAPNVSEAALRTQLANLDDVDAVDESYDMLVDALELSQRG